MLTCCSAYAYIVSVVSIIPEVATILARDLDLPPLAKFVAQVCQCPAAQQSRPKKLSCDVKLPQFTRSG